MTVNETLVMLTQCAIGAVIVTGEGIITEANREADRLLHGHNALVGKKIQEIAPGLISEKDPRQFVNIRFRDYITRTPAPRIELPKDRYLVTFRQAKNDVCLEMMMAALNKTSESVILYDEQGRLFWLNETAKKIDLLETSDVIGKDVAEIYHMLDESELLIPQILSDGEPRTGQRQQYRSYLGKEVEILGSFYPVKTGPHILGAFDVREDYSKMDELQRQVIALQEELLRKPGRTQNAAGRRLRAQHRFRDIVYTGEEMKKLVAKCRQIARTDAPLLISGEEGTGKEMLAQCIHSGSARAEGPFLTVRCGDQPLNLLERMLFGVEGGVFEEEERRPGLFEQSQGGTLFIEDLQDMPHTLQPRILRVLTEGVIRRVGGLDDVMVDVRVLFSTGMPPHEAVERGLLRRDLMYGIRAGSVTVPPLRERREDIPLLVRSFIAAGNQRFSKNASHADPEVLAVFRDYTWPGNVRELSYCIEYAMNLMPKSRTVITPDDLPEHLASVSSESGDAHGASGRSFSAGMQSAERSVLTEALIGCGGNISQAARSLGISRQSLQYRLKKNHIDVRSLMGQ